jgi:hypothetical protein
MTAEVECYAGSTYPEKPRAFSWEGQRYEVQTILDQYREPDGIGFRVRCLPGGMLFNLFYSFSEDRWRIQSEGPVIDDNAQTNIKFQGD